MKMTEKYIDAFTHTFSDNMIKVIPRTIIEKVGNLSNLKLIVMRCLEILYLDHSIIDRFTSTTVEHILNCVINFIQDKKDAIRDFSMELKSQSWFS